MKKSIEKILGVTLVACMTISSLAGYSSSPGEQATTPAGGESVAGESAAQSTATEDPIKVGVSNMVTGPMAAGDIRMKQAITMVLEGIDADDGVLSERPLEMILVDDTETLTGAVSAVNEILGENVSVSVGPHISPVASVAQEPYRRAGIPFISTATSPKLLKAENPYFFRISVLDGTVEPTMAEFAKGKFGAKRINALCDTDDYGVAVGGATEQYRADNGIEYYSEGFTSGDKDLASQLSKIKGWGPDVMFDFSHDAEATLIVRQLNGLGVGGIPYVGPSALAQSQTCDLCDARQLESTYASTNFYTDESNEAMKKFLDDFHARWGEDVGRYATVYYTAAYLTADAIDRTGSDKPGDIRKALSETKDFDAVFDKLSYGAQSKMDTNLYILEFDGERNMNVTQQMSLD